MAAAATAAYDRLADALRSAPDLRSKTRAVAAYQREAASSAPEESELLKKLLAAELLDVRVPRGQITMVLGGVGRPPLCLSGTECACGACGMQDGAFTEPFGVGPCVHL